jgi:hypothetical protein
MITRLLGSALIIHGLESMEANELFAKALLMTGAIVIILAIKMREYRLKLS